MKWKKKGGFCSLRSTSQLFLNSEGREQYSLVPLNHSNHSQMCISSFRPKRTVLLPSHKLLRAIMATPNSCSSSLYHKLFPMFPISRHCATLHPVANARNLNVIPDTFLSLLYTWIFKYCQACLWIDHESIQLSPSSLLQPWYKPPLILI